MGTSLVVQWLRLHTPNAGGPGFEPWLENWIPLAATKNSHTTIKDPAGHSEDQRQCKPQKEKKKKQQQQWISSV